jgi:spermidine synthase
LLPLRVRVFTTLYLLSGAAALLYEVAWLRLLTMSTGHTTAAVGAVLAAFMGGLTIGAWAGGRISSGLRPTRALRIYAALEITIAVFALVIPLALDAMRPLLAWAYADGTGGVVFGATRLAISILLIASPAAAMGASFPVGVVAVGDTGIRGATGATRAKSAAAELYAANTVGAAIGAGVCGFVLLPALGLFGTTVVGVVLNSIAALGAMALSGGKGLSHRSHLRTHLAHPPHPSHHSYPSHLSTTVIIAISGFVALVYEVIWTRVLAMTLGPTTYAFSAMLVAFIAGLAVGSAVAAALVPRIRRPDLWLGGAMIAAAAAAQLASWRVDRLPITIALTAGRSDASFTSVFALDVVIAVAMLMPLTIALGATLPFAITLTARGAENEAPPAAIIYAANSLGAIAGALAASFILVPQLGLQRSLQLASIVAVAAAAFVARTVPARAAAVAVIALALMLPAWNHTRLVSGAYRLAPIFAARDVETALDAGDLVYYGEGAAGTVSVRELIGVRSLAIDGKVDASNGSDMLTQKLLAHLPLLLHDDPHDVYIIGLGSGVTLASALTHPIDRAVVSEISPEVVAASRAFSAENHDALDDQRAHLIVGDGRSHLLLSQERYDVIISEPSNPWMAGVSTLFTREFFAAAHRRLTPGGILCQWAHTYNIGDADLRSIVSTFLSEFPEGSAWLVGESDLLLLGSSTRIRALDEGVTRAWQRAGVAADLAQVAVQDPFSVLTLFVGRGADLRAYVDGAALQTDDRLSLEFSAPRAIYGRFQNANVDRLRSVAARAQLPAAVAMVRASATADQWRNRAAMQMKAESPQLAYDDYLQALRLAPNDPLVLAGYVGAAAASNRLDAAERYLRGRIAAGDAASLEVELSRVLGARGDLKSAAAAAQRAAALDSSSDRALEQLATVLGDDRNDGALEQLTVLLVRTGATRPVTLYAQMRLAGLRGRFDQAAVFGERLVASGGDEENAARNYNLLGIAYDSAGNHDKAREAFETSLRIAPRAPAVLMNVALSELRAGRHAEAEKRFSEALFLYPTLTAARDGLAQARAARGD